MFIVCKKSKKTNSKYFVFVVNDVFVTFDRLTIEKIAMTNGISNIELNKLDVDDRIDII